MLFKRPARRNALHANHLRSGEAAQLERAVLLTRPPPSARALISCADRGGAARWRRRRHLQRRLRRALSLIRDASRHRHAGRRHHGEIVDVSAGDADRHRRELELRQIDVLQRSGCSAAAAARRARIRRAARSSVESCRRAEPVAAGVSDDVHPQRAHARAAARANHHHRTGERAAVRSHHGS